MENFEDHVGTKESLYAEKERLEEALRFKKAQTAANIAAGIVQVGEEDQDMASLEAELAAVTQSIGELSASEQNDRMNAARQMPIEGIE